ncbi:exosortase family protein XrtG [uncultured Neglectibacter sp.]|uniref:exosortase family protein XrtG n=1 Tax=uncultured Neglectibacter sp. TaxID=1924108 RepID=UPI0034DE0727
MSVFFYLLAIGIWLALLTVTKRAELHAWHFLIGSAGLFILLMVVVRPVATQPLAQVVSALVGAVGKLTGQFSAYFKYGIIFLSTHGESLTLQIDFECSGIIEIAAFESLLCFFNVYSSLEKLLLAIIGFCYIMLANAFRILVICFAVCIFGPGAYYVVHAIVGRILFYILSIYLYFYIFTKPQVVRMKVGSFVYAHPKENP